MSNDRKPAAPKKRLPKSLAEEVAEALGSLSRPSPAVDELADRESGSPGPIAADDEKP
ncbi:MAG: hypothetical protein JWL84_3193 [Rhodospirillales bacterium]|jgi:hypothetical protein|nr:hypothetical protein [Rhodospirillales bacterium]